MATIYTCSVTDATLRLKTTLAAATAEERAAVWYGGPWLGAAAIPEFVNAIAIGSMFFEIVLDLDLPGLYYWPPWCQYS